MQIIKLKIKIGIKSLRNRLIALINWNADIQCLRVFEG